MLNTTTHIYKSHIKLRHMIMANINIADLHDIKIIKPNQQRILDSEKVSEIETYQEKYFKTNGYFNFIGTINIHCYEGNNYLVDGQHRLESGKLLNAKGFSVDMVFEIITINSKESLLENFKIINKNTELPEFPDDIDKHIAENACQYYFNIYKQVFKINRKPEKPHINKNSFQEAVGYLLSELNTRRDKAKVPKEYDVEDIKKLIEEKNKEVGNWGIDSWNEYRKLKKWAQYKIIADKYGFYLGMFPIKDEVFVYDWVKDIITQQTGSKIYKKKRTRKCNKIPKIIKDQVWKQYMPNIHESKCMCCSKNSITSNQFHCGHVLSRSNGGSNSVDNMRPICQSCNLGMKTRHMREYMEDYYPSNVEKTFPILQEFGMIIEV